MQREHKLARKIKRFLKRLGYPRWLHHFGPKTYRLSDHVIALVAIAIFRLSLRRAEHLLGMFGMKIPTYSALCKSRKRIPSLLWQRIIALTAGATHACVAIDSTGIARANPSFHYVKRIDRINPIRSFVKQSSLFDVQRRTFVALRVRSTPRHDVMDAKYLLKRAEIQTTLLGDKAYDANWLHQLCYQRGIQTHIPPRARVKKGFYRRKQMKHYSEKEYHQRSLIEAGQGAVKRKYGGYTLAKRIEAIRAEAYCKAIAYNMRLRN